MKRLVILGSTGSIGRQTLDVVRHLPNEFQVLGLAAGRNLSLLREQISEFRPSMVCCAEPAEQDGLLPRGVRFASLEEMVQDPRADLVVVANTGRIGLLPVLKALEQGKAVALANKEVIVMAGELVTKVARQHGGTILPIDSEPSAIWQCLQGEDRSISRVILTASGGAFRDRPIEELDKVTPEEALKHPTWKMGNKITVDSASLMNKAFEVIEVHWLFDIPWEKIEVVIHHQSVVHSMVEFADGSVKAQLSPPDMRLPIQYALLYPRRLPNECIPRLNTSVGSALTFQPLDTRRYPCFSLALEVGKRGGTYPAVLSAADEVAVELFLNRKIKFTDIPKVVEWVVEQYVPPAETTLETILAGDAWGRQRALEAVGVW